MTRGRHRKPVPPSRVAKSASVVLAATAVSATPMMSSVAYADTSVWDEIAQCESSGNWSTDTGNGYSGGLQFSPSTWREFGGTQFASNAAEASRTEQIKVATSVQQAQGWGAWPVCSKKAGASGDPPAVDRAPAETTPDAPAAAPSDPTTETYVVQSGDTLGEIARERSSGRTALDLAESSGIANPDVIRPGQTINLSSQSVPTPSEDAPSPSQNTSTGSHRATNSAVGIARTWIGTEYAWGGNSKSGVDCSGLVQQVFGDMGVELPRTAAAQSQAVTRIDRDEARAGDLVFGTTGGRVTHVGIYMGDGKQIDSPNSGSSVGVHSLYRNQTTFGRVE